MSNLATDAPEIEPERDPRKCEWTHPDGTTCNGWKVGGAGGTLCAGHLGLGIAGNLEAAREKSAKVRRDRAEAGKSASLNALERELSKAMPNIAKNWARQAESDHKAAETLLARLYGKPTERVELGEISVDEATLRDPQARAQAKEALLARYPGLRAIVGGDEAEGSTST